MIANVNNRRRARVFLCCLLEDFDMKLYVEHSFSGFNCKHSKMFIHMPLEIFVVEQETLYLSKREHCTI